MPELTQTDGFAGHALLIDGLVFLSPREALPLLEEDAVLVDLREEFEKSGREFDVKSLVSLPYETLADAFANLPRDARLILADTVGVRSKEAARFLKDRGYGSVASLIGGMVDWAREGMPTKVDRDLELVGECGCSIGPRKDHRSPFGR